MQLLGFGSTGLVGIVTGPQAECLKNYGLIHNRDIYCVHGKMHYDWFNGIEILQGRWQHGEKVGYCYPSGLEKTLCKWDICVLLVTKGLRSMEGQAF
jgi:hypothetical protein